MLFGSSPIPELSNKSSLSSYYLLNIFLKNFINPFYVHTVISMFEIFSDTNSSKSSRPLMSDVIVRFVMLAMIV